MLKSKNVLNWTHIRYDPNALKDYVNFCKAIKAGHVVSFYSPISYWRRSLSKMYLFIYNWYRLRTYIGKKTVETNLSTNCLPCEYWMRFHLRPREWGQSGGRTRTCESGWRRTGACTALWQTSSGSPSWSCALEPSWRYFFWCQSKFLKTS